MGLAQDPALPEPSTGLPRLAYSKAEAAHSLGVSVDYFHQHVLPDLRVVRRGRKVLIAKRELERWLDEQAAMTLRENMR